MQREVPTAADISKEALRIALLQLLEDQPLQKIKITQLCQRAGVSRMAYYRNYTSILDLYQDVISHLLKDFLIQVADLIEQGQWLDFWKAFFSYIFQNQSSVRLILGHQEEVEILHYLNKVFIPADAHLSMEENFYIRGIIGLTFNIMLAWVESNFEMDQEEIALLCNKMIQISPQTKSLHHYFD